VLKPLAAGLLSYGLDQLLCRSSDALKGFQELPVETITRRHQNKVPIDRAGKTARLSSSHLHAKPVICILGTFEKIVRRCAGVKHGVFFHLRPPERRLFSRRLTPSISCGA